ncbi:hypothetical protein I7I50_04343 [Histoplasma capsulatum G186AR]|uniref:Uncharacterized protein n=1 Tax=Ajellomyces capsulatus TaxID=5037 RepID=A0A8H7YMA1_AJECA|nr:hypothetical protein I7I52_05251 [Histoplasma capsulatum]QSS75263.1 hypothetical protein I7I50_04343 [Histoplasma capsulatum G186AR]
MYGPPFAQTGWHFGVWELRCPDFAVLWALHPSDSITLISTKRLNNHPECSNSANKSYLTHFTRNEVATRCGMKGNPITISTGNQRTNRDVVNPKSSITSEEQHHFL